MISNTVLASGVRSSDANPVKAIRVAICLRCCMHYRVPAFRQLNAHPALSPHVFYGRSIPGTKLANAKNIDGFAHRQLPTLIGWIRSGRRSTPLVFFPSLFWALLRYRPDVLVTSGGGNAVNNVVIYWYAWMFAKPVVWWTLGRLPGRRHTDANRLYGVVAERMERSAGALLGYSSLALGYFRRMGYLRKRSFRAVNSVDTRAIFCRRGPDLLKAVTVKREHSIIARTVVLFAGALTSGKRVDRLINAVARLTCDPAEVQLMIVGDGAERGRLEGLVRDLSLERLVIFVGQVVDGVGAYFEASDLFVLPGLGGLAISEALAHGLPVICTRADGCEVDLVRDGHTGYRILAVDEEVLQKELVQRIGALAANPTLRAAMSSAASELMQSEQSFDNYVADVAEAIEYAHASSGRSLRRRLLRIGGAALGRRGARASKRP